MHTLYIVAPEYSLAEREFNRTLAEALRPHGFEVILQQERIKRSNVAPEDAEFEYRVQARRREFAALTEDLMIAILDGADVDSGVAFEVGLRHRERRYVIGVRTDRRPGEDPFSRANGIFRLLDAVVLYDGEAIADLATAIAEEVHILLEADETSHTTF